MRISEIKENKNGGVTLRLENGAIVILADTTDTQYEPVAGEDISPQLFDAAMNGSSDSVRFLSAEAKDAAAKIASRAIFSGGLVRKLAEKGFQQAEAEAAAIWLQGLGAIDDADTAERYAEKLFRSGKGARAIFDALKQKGCAQDTARAATDALPEPDNIIDRLLAEKLRGKTPDRDSIAKASASLARRGYAWGDIRAAAQRLGQDDIEESED